MYRFLFRPKWIAFHLLCLGAVFLMINLGLWQLRRLDERKEFNSEVAERSELPPVSIDELLADPNFSPDDATWRRVTAQGVWLPQQVTVFNRSQDGLAGDNVLTALEQDNGTTVLVNRGFVPVGVDQPPAPSGDVEIIGTVRESQARRRGELTDQGLSVSEVRRIDPEQLAAQFPGTVAPVYLDLIESDPPTDGIYPAPVPPPELSEGPHLSYAFQWFIFSAAVVVGWVLAVRRSINTRRNAAADDPSDDEAADGTDDRNMEQMSRSARQSLQISGEGGSGATSGAQEAGDRSGVAAGETTTE
jgi:cytochrome oxidase assembly protein ShyY1